MDKPADEIMHIKLKSIASATGWVGKFKSVGTNEPTLDVLAWGLGEDNGLYAVVLREGNRPDAVPVEQIELILRR